MTMKGVDGIGDDGKPEIPVGDAQEFRTDASSDFQVVTYFVPIAVDNLTQGADILNTDNLQQVLSSLKALLDFYRRLSPFSPNHERVIQYYDAYIALLRKISPILPEDKKSKILGIAFLTIVNPRVAHKFLQENGLLPEDMLNSILDPNNRQPLLKRTRRLLISVVINNYDEMFVSLLRSEDPIPYSRNGEITLDDNRAYAIEQIENAYDCIADGIDTIEMRRVCSDDLMIKLTSGILELSRLKDSIKRTEKLDQDKFISFYIKYNELAKICSQFLKISNSRL